MSPLDQAQETEHIGRRFELIERVGKGAFGEVYLAMQLGSAGFERRVALKVLNARSFGDQDATRRIRDEARVLGRLNHRHIVTVIDLVNLSDRWALVMEYVDGADLEQTLLALDRAGRLFPAAAALEVVAAVADALDAAYNATGPDGQSLQVIHRDIKPANIRITPNGAVKVLDFGIAHTNMESREAHTGAFIIGTQLYMAPERIAGRPEHPSADVYSLAATAIEMMTGQPVGRSPVLSDRHQRHIQERLTGVAKQISMGSSEHARSVVALLARCLDGEPDNRPSAAEFAVLASRLARQLDTEPLQVFCRRFIPQVSRLLGRQRELVSGVLTERTTSRLPVDIGLPETLREAARAVSDEPKRRRWLGPLLALLSGVVVVVLGMVLLTMATGLGATLLWVSLPGQQGAEPAFETPLVAPVGAAAREVTPDAAVQDRAVDVLDAVQSGSVDPIVDPAQNVAVEPVVQVRKVRRARVAPEVEVVLLSRAQVSVAGATSLRVQCGGVVASGTASARIMKFPAGECAVVASVEGRSVETTVQILSPRAVRCTVGAEGLRCD
ncbi:MAG: hypothetical protein ACI9MC_003413 [Kiritimatiellia bacterium]|jgi:hypothetical protein